MNFINTILIILRFFCDVQNEKMSCKDTGSKSGLESSKSVIEEPIDVLNDENQPLYIPLILPPNATKNGQ